MKNIDDSSPLIVNTRRLHSAIGERDWLECPYQQPASRGDWPARAMIKPADLMFKLRMGLPRKEKGDFEWKGSAHL